MAQLNAVKIAADKLFSGDSIHKQDGLLAYMQPLIAALSAKECSENSELDYYKVSRAYLTSLIDQVPIAVFCLDRNFKITRLSFTALNWLKSHYFKGKKAFSAEDVLGEKFNDIFSPCPKPLGAALKNALKGKVWRAQSLKQEIKNKDYCYWLQWEVFPWLDQNGEVTDVIVFLEDTTSHQELLLSNKKLQQSNELLESFNLIFSHDLIQPLRQISNFLDIIQEHYEGIDSAQAPMNQVFTALQKSFDHIRNLSEGIVLYCKKGDLTVESEQISLKCLIEEIYESILKSEKCQFNFQFSEDVYLHANRTCMLQLFQNLFANAIKHSSCENCIITLSGAREDENFYRFHLHNHGYCPGYIRKRNVFLPFQSSASDGAGLGLMICKKIISAYKGKITLRSGKRKGTVVSFTLPFCEKKLEKLTELTIQEPRYTHTVLLRNERKLS